MPRREYTIQVPKAIARKFRGYDLVKARTGCTPAQIKARLAAMERMAL